MFLYFIFFILYLQFHTINGWWCNGHMLVASIASRNLNNNTVKGLEPYITEHALSYPKSNSFITSACWADDLKTYGNMANEEWHFATFPYIKSAIFDSLDNFRNDSMVIWAINQAKNILTSKTTLLQDKSRYLSFLIHFVGDIHQPLHIATLFSSDFKAPEGDRGGNKYDIKGEHEDNLHMFWDAGVGMWEDEQDRPLNNSGIKYLDSWTDKIISLYPKDKFTDLLNEKNVEEWAKENFEFAVDMVYNTPLNEKPSDDYINKSRDICMRLVALAGYRLANLLNEINYTV